MDSILVFKIKKSERANVSSQSDLVVYWQAVMLKVTLVNLLILSSVPVLTDPLVRFFFIPNFYSSAQLIIQKYPYFKIKQDSYKVTQNQI